MTGTATVLTIHRLGCRWPFGDPGERDFALCGRRVARGSYCDDHAAIGYRPRAQGEPDLLKLTDLN